MYSRNMFTPPMSVLRPKYPIQRANYEDININDCVFKAIKDQHEILKKLLVEPEIFQKVLQHPSRKLLVQMRDSEYIEYTTLYMKSTIPEFQKLSIFPEKDKTIIEFTVDL